MSNYDFLKKRERNKTLILVEGPYEKNTILKVMIECFDKLSINISNIYIYKTDIYDLYHYIEKKYGEHWFEGDVNIDLPLLISDRFDLNPKLDRRDFTNIILIFDYEHHDNWYSDEKIQRLQNHFSNSSEDGMLYINYPMVEALLHMSSIPDLEYLNKSISVKCNPGSKYKSMIRKDSVLFRYLNVYNSIWNYIRKNIFELNDRQVDELVFNILSLSDVRSLREDIFTYIKSYNVDMKKLNNMKYSISKQMISLEYLGEKITYWKKLKELLMNVTLQNIEKAWAIQENNFEKIKISKEVYEKLDWNRILENQNKAGSNPEFGVIWVLCTCIIFLGEYKFFWTEMENNFIC